MKTKKSNGIFYVVISFVAVLGIGSIVAAYSLSTNINVSNGGVYNNYEAEQAPLPTEEVLGANSGPNFYQPVRLYSGLGGNVWATSTTATALTLTEANLLDYTVIEATPNAQAGLAYTLPATSTLSTLLKNVGDSQTWVFQNATTTAAATFTLVAGTGWNLSGDDANVDVIAGAAYTARVSQYVQCYRQANTDIHCNIQEAIAAD